jgi:quinoprotein glucose dehydrogenase
VWRVLVCPFLTLALTCPLSADPPAGLGMIDQGQHDARLKGYFASQGIKVEIVAAEPAVQGPIALTFDAEGMLYVLEGGAKSAKGRVKLLRDNKGKGVFEEAKILLEEESLSGILAHDGWLYLAQKERVCRYRLEGLSKDAKAQTIAQGRGEGGRRQFVGLAVGGDGLLYVAWEGGDHVIGSDGSREKVRGSGAVFRCQPDGSKIEVFAQGFSKPGGPMSFDAAGNLFCTDSSGRAFADRRLLYVAEGNDFGRRPDYLPPLLKLGPGRLAGVLVYEDTHLSELYRGRLFYADVRNRQVRACRIRRRGAGFEMMEQGEILKSSDPDFHPTQLAIGPEGAIYVCDSRMDPDRAERQTGSKQGRIYRLSSSGSKTDDEPERAPRGPDHWAKLRQLSDMELVKILSAPDLSDRQRASAELVHRARHKQADAKKVVPALLQLVKDGEGPLPGRLMAVGALEAFGNADVAETFSALLRDPNPDLRRLAAEGLGRLSRPGDRDAHEALIQALSDEDPAVRRAVLLAIARVNAAGAADVLVNALQFDEGKDKLLHDGILCALERLGRPAMDKLLALADSGEDADRARVVAAFLDFRSPSAAQALPMLLRNVHLTPAQRAALQSKKSSTKNTNEHE